MNAVPNLYGRLHLKHGHAMEDVFASFPYPLHTSMMLIQMHERTSTTLWSTRRQQLVNAYFLAFLCAVPP